MNRKLRNLLASPNLFARDAIRKRAHQLRERLPRIRKVSSPRRYSVVSAVYQVEAYLDEYFRSITRQTLDFERHIELILVDDGSTDGSADIIARWQAAHPRAAIRYVRKENGGQASARNVGLELASGDWVTFVDPDDTLDERYFERVDRLLSRPDARNVILAACKIVFRREDQLSDTHALRSQFARGDMIAPVEPESTVIQLSAASAFFRTDLLRAKGRRFDERIRPHFEDGHFVGRYLVENPGGSLGLCASAVYHYRKRSDRSSTLDASWSHPERFGAVPELGYLDLLRASAAASEEGRPARWAQRTVLYELAWYLHVLLERPSMTAFLPDAQRVRFHELLREIVSLLDERTILDFELAECSFAHKVGLLGIRGRTPPPRVIVDRHDDRKHLLRLRYAAIGEPQRESIAIGADEIASRFEKTLRLRLAGEPFVHERILWAPVGQSEAALRVQIGASDAEIDVAGLPAARAQRIGDVVEALSPARRLSSSPWAARAEHRLATSGLVGREYRDALVFIDRDTQADDNAEHLYRYVRRARPDLNALFVLRRDSHDWSRLEREGFRLIPFGSFGHRLALVNARHLISSQADHFVLAFPTVRHRKLLQRSRFTFLQHGVIKDDLSAWLNKKEIDCFVTASAAEHASIVDPDGPYRFTRREVALTGLPRHDALGAGDPKPERLVLVMPTWRESVVGPAIGKTSVHTRNPRFAESELARRWKSFLHAPELRVLADAHGYRVRFFPHPNLEPYLDWFEAPSFVEADSPRRGHSMQEVFRSAALMVTDYSSTAFEMAYLRRPVLYYQFDHESAFGGGHTTQKGYFDYERDGFGPVCLDQPTLMRELGALLAAGAVAAPEHLARMERALAFRDGQSCRRTLQAILDLDRPHHESTP